MFQGKGGTKLPVIRTSNGKKREYTEEENKTNLISQQKELRGNRRRAHGKRGAYKFGERKTGKSSIQ
jgi:hypothetical protein